MSFISKLKKFKLASIAAVSVLSLGLLSTGTFVGKAEAAGLATPNYEVKLYMDPGVSLDSNHDLKSSVRSYFGMPSSKTKMNMQFIDDDAKDLDAQGWLARVRKMEGFSDSDFEVTYKKRYPITNGDINAALTQAAAEGFDADENDYEAQVDWGYTKQTLSFSNTKMVSHSGYTDMDLMNKTDSVSELVSHAPGKFQNWLWPNWGTDILQSSTNHKYGPVSGKRWEGTWRGQKIYIEVWEIIETDGTGYDRIVEASFKNADYNQSASLKAQLQADLTAQGWFSATDELKTQMILDRY
jgi:hypothetical protein